jgi:hypothetical protein
MRSAKDHPKKFHFCQYCQFQETLIFSSIYQLCCHLRANHPNAPEIAVLEQQLPPREKANLRRHYAGAETENYPQHTQKEYSANDVDLPPPDLVFAPLKEIENQFGLYPAR